MSLLLVVHCIILLVLYNRLMIVLVVCTNQRVASMYDCCLTINIWFVWYMRNLTVHCLWAQFPILKWKGLWICFYHSSIFFFSFRKNSLSLWCWKHVIYFSSLLHCWIPLTNILIMSYFQATNENLPPNVIKQLAKELKNLDESPPEGIKVGVNDDDFSTIFADIEGPGM